MELVLWLGLGLKATLGLGLETGANVSPGFRARAGTDAAPGAGAGVWARESGVRVQIGFVDVIVSRIPCV